jgi:hypothetical protein
VMREAQHQANFEAAMEPSRQLHKEWHLAMDAVAAAGLRGELGQRPLSLSAGRARGSLGIPRGRFNEEGGAGGGCPTPGLAPRSIVSAKMS